MQFKSIKTKLLVSVLAAGLSISSCFAANVLSQIEISPADVGGYKISFGAQKPDEVKKIVSSSDKMVLELKGISVSSAYNTIYDNVADIDSVVVDAVTKNSAKITFEGKDIANSQIFFETVQGAEAAVGDKVAQTNTNDAIELARPVSEYAPVYSKEYVEDMESEGSILENAKLSLASLLKNRRIRRIAKYGIREAKNHASKENLAYILLGIGFLALLFKVMSPAKKQESASIGLAQTLKQREMERVQNMDIASKIEETKQKTMDPSFNSNAGYAMKSYQASQKNPYTSSLHRPMNARTSMTKKPSISAKNNLSQASAKRVSAPINNDKKINIDSTKFLESMAKIYEKNGRVDLARGLKANMQKATSKQKISA